MTKPGSTPLTVNKTLCGHIDSNWGHFICVRGLVRDFQLELDKAPLGVTAKANILWIHRATHCWQRLLWILFPDYKTGLSSNSSDFCLREECFSCSQISIELSKIIEITYVDSISGWKLYCFPGLNLPLVTRHNQREKDSMQGVGERRIIQESDESRWMIECRYWHRHFFSLSLPPLPPTLIPSVPCLISSVPVSWCKAEETEQAFWDCWKYSHMRHNMIKTYYLTKLL